MGGHRWAAVGVRRCRWATPGGPGRLSDWLRARKADSRQIKAMAVREPARRLL
jgi:hypothetical protein